jgi:hypothetical protein
MSAVYSVMVGQLKAAEALRQGVGKRAFLVPEEFAFQQAGGDGGTVQFHEGLRPPRAERMERPRQQFFPGPRLAVEEHGCIGRGHEFHLVQDAAERGARADDLGKVPVAVAAIFHGERLLGECVLECG